MKPTIVLVHGAFAESSSWNDVIAPVLIGIGERYEATQRFVEVEHMISRTMTEVLSSVSRPDSSAVPRAGGAGPAAGG